MPAIGHPCDYNTGPSRDWDKITSAEPIWHEEPFQLNPQRIPVLMATKQRPLTVPSPIVAMPLQRVPVMVRLSNQSPVEAGSGKNGSRWIMSDPGKPFQSTDDGSEPLAGLGDDYLDNAVPANPNATAAAIGPVTTPAPTPVVTVAAPASTGPSMTALLGIGALIGLVVYLGKK